MVRGYQVDDLSAADAVVACVKHFALYGASKAGRDYHAVDMSRREMEETFFPPYRAAVDAGARTVMASFNVIDGIPATCNHWLLTEILRDAWGFEGWLVTDYTGISEMKCHGTAATDADAARQSLDAGVDMDMMSEAYIVALPELVESGAIHEEQLDVAVMRVLETKWDLGLFADPFARCEEARVKKVHLCASHRALAREAAREAMVLLKNDDLLLPLQKDASIALIGPLADSRRDMLGCWIAAGDAGDAVSLLDGIGKVATVIFSKGCEIDSENIDLLEDAIRAARQADVTVLMLGESWAMSGEAASRTDIRLPEAQRKLAEAILETGKPLVLVTVSGRPLDLSWEDKHFATLLHAWALGTEAGHALADVIFGTAAPVGKLTMGFPRHVGQVPMTYREKPTGRPFDVSVNYTSKYLDCPNDALFPFGHGLTYGQLEIGEPELDSAEMRPGGTVTLSVEVANPGSREVTETLQLYLRDRVASVSRPVKELRGYQRVTLAAGTTKIVSFEITDSELAFPGKDFLAVVEAGDFEAMVGMSSAILKRVKFTRLADEG